jgi:MFS family permease
LVVEGSRDFEEDSSTKTSRARYAYVLLLATGFLFFSFVARYGYGFLVPRIIEEMGFSRAEAGFVYSIFTFMYATFSVISGRLFDRYGTRVVAILSFVYGLGLVLASASSSFLALTTSLAVAGLGASSSWTPMVTLVSSNLPKSWSGWSIGLLEAGVRASQGSVGFLVPLIIFVAGLRAVWWIISLPLFVYGLVFCVLSRSRLLRVKVTAHKQVISYKALLPSKEFWLVGLSYLSMSFANYIVLTFLVDFLEHEVGMPYREASAVAGIMGFTGMAGAFLLSWASDKMGRVTVLVLSNALASLSVYLTALSPSNEALSASLSLVVATYGVFSGAPWPIYAACAGDLFPSSVGTVLGLWTLMMGLGALAAPTIGGLLADVSNSYVPALLLSSTAYLVAMSLMVATAITRGRQGSPRA